MCVFSWADEFYPVPAGKCLDNNPSDLDLLTHSLLKWEGAKSKNLKKHDVKYKDASVFDDRMGLVFDHYTCALCLKYNNKVRVSCYNELDPCPIVKHTGRSCIAEYKESEKSPTSMISLLKKVIKKERKHANKTV